MKKMARVGLLFLISMCMVMHANSQTVPVNNSPAPVVFVATTPCSTGTRPVPGIPKEGPCELIKWQLKVFGDIDKPRSGTYVLDCVYGVAKQGTKGFKNGGDRLHREGKWVIAKSTKSDPFATIYRLDPDKPLVSISFVRLNENLLHLLDSRQQLMIGNGAWSYTLNKLQK